MVGLRVGDAVADGVGCDGANSPGMKVKPAIRANTKTRIAGISQPHGKRCCGAGGGRVVGGIGRVGAAAGTAGLDVGLESAVGVLLLGGGGAG